MFGELYAMNQSTLDQLDILEGVGTAWGYTRDTIGVVTASGVEMEVYAYLKRRENLTTIHSGSLEIYELDKRYVLPRDRE